MNVVERLLQGNVHDRDFYAALDEADLDDLGAILALAGDEDPAVRVSVASTLPFVHSHDLHPDGVVETLIHLTLDPDPRVRDWACCGLGAQLSNVDTPELRDALLARLDDIDADARCEAMAGLARRRDPRVVPYVRRALSRPSGDLYRMELISAGALSDPSLHELVLGHLVGWSDRDMEQTTEAVRRLTDPAGPGEDLLAGVAELYRRRASGRPDGDAIGSWALMDKMLDIAPYRAPEFLRAVNAYLTNDQTALDLLLTNSALSQEAAEIE